MNIADFKKKYGDEFNSMFHSAAFQAALQVVAFSAPSTRLASKSDDELTRNGTAIAARQAGYSEALTKFATLLSSPDVPEPEATYARE